MFEFLCSLLAIGFIGFVFPILQWPELTENWEKINKFVFALIFANIAYLAGHAGIKVIGRIIA